MKALIVATALMCATAVASAQSNVSSTTAAMSAAQNAGNAQAITFNQPGNSDATLRSAPTVYAPNPIAPFTQASCIYSATGGLSLIGFGLGGSAPIDGATCNWRLGTQQAQASAAAFRDLSLSPKAAPTDAAILAKKADAMMTLSVNMQCLNSDRQRAVMEKLGMCSDVADLATLDHRFNQPKNYQVDYSTAPAKSQ